MSLIHYGVPTIRRLLMIICLFCKRALLKRQYSSKETYNFKEPTHHSHPIARYCLCFMRVVWYVHGSVNVYVCVCEGVFVHVCECMCACVYACTQVCVCMWVC